MKSRKETESVIKYLHINKSPGQEGFIGLNYIKHLKKKKYQSFLNSHENRESNIFKLI